MDYWTRDLDLNFFLLGLEDSDSDVMTRTQRWWLGLGLGFDNLDSDTALVTSWPACSQVAHKHNWGTPLMTGELESNLYFNEVQVPIDLMHMTSQKDAPACWGSNEALSCAPSPSMQPAGQPLHAIPPGRPGLTHWLRANALPAQQRQVLTPKMASLLWRCDVNA